MTKRLLRLLEAKLGRSSLSAESSLHIWPVSFITNKSLVPIRCAALLAYWIFCYNCNRTGLCWLLVTSRIDNYNYTQVYRAQFNFCHGEQSLKGEMNTFKGHRIGRGWRMSAMILEQRHRSRERPPLSNNSKQTRATLKGGFEWHSR